MKSYTDLEQSKRLAEILPLESADMHWQYIEEDNGQLQWFYFPKDFSINQHDNIPCWSLAALLDNIPQVKLDNIKQYDKKHWRCCAYFASDWHNSDWCNNPVDACYEMILKLHENVEVKPWEWKPWEWDSEKGCSYPACQISKKNN